MPKRQDLKKILIIGAGPIIIGQACEFDYSGTQACKALKQEGYEVVLVNSNPATIMTDPDFADKTYIEPINVKHLSRIIQKEKPDAILPTMGGQTSLNVTLELAKAGVLEEHNVELLGANLESIEVAEDRDKFKNLMNSIGLKSPVSKIANTLSQAIEIAKEISFPIIIRPAFTLGGYGGGIAYNLEELNETVAKGLSASPNGQVLVEQSVAGWKEIEFEVMRDKKDNAIIICAIENLDPMGVHTGDSITVAPTQTLSDKEYQELRNASIKIIRAVGVETGGSNVQFAMNPSNGEILVIEMNPRVSRSSALASKATGFPIAKIAAKLAVGYSLDEIPNDITQKTMASFEPSIDYVVTKIPRFAFEKFPESEDQLGTQMKSVGETMAIGRSFQESFQKALRGLETKGPLGLINSKLINKNLNIDEIESKKQKVKAQIQSPSSQRIHQLFDAFYLGMSLEEVQRITKIDNWFLYYIKDIVDETSTLKNNFKASLLANKNTKLKEVLSKSKLLELKRKGFSDKQLALILSEDSTNTEAYITSEKEIRDYRHSNNLRPVFKTIDTCAAEFESYTPYYYSTYEEENEIMPSTADKVFIIGGGPNRIGQGIEFDYCCVHASQILRADGYESIMINNNPETVSTDYDTSSRLYFEPVTVEDVLEIYHQEGLSTELGDRGKLHGAIVQLGGQTPLNISKELESEGVNILGTKPTKIELAEDRDLFGRLIQELGLKQTTNSIAYSYQETAARASELGFPVVLRPSYVLGGRGMEITYSQDELNKWFERTILEDSQMPILIDKFLDQAIEIDVDAISDGKEVIIAGIMEHIEYAGIHSGDSASVFPPQTISKEVIDEIEFATVNLAKALNVQGLMNIQFATKNSKLYILEVNPRASRTVPFISKATGVPWAKLASQIMSGKKIRDLNIPKINTENKISVKEAVFSFNKFDNMTMFLGPEMKSTGEVMGISDNFPMAFAKAQLGANLNLPEAGKVFFSFNDRDKEHCVQLAQELIGLGFEIVATSGTADMLEQNNLNIERTLKAKEGRPNITDKLINKEITLIFNIPLGKKAYEDSVVITKLAQQNNIPVITTVTGAAATIKALQSLKEQQTKVRALQDFILARL